jgi:hypothetical protein
MTEPTKLRVSYSSLGTFSSCPRKFEFQKLYPRLARDGDSFAADVGSALHAGYQDFLIHGDEDRATWALMESYPYRGEFEQSNDYRSLEACISTLDAMMGKHEIREYELAQIKKPDGSTVPAIEVPFEIEFRGLAIEPCESLPHGATLSVIGYIDAIMKNHLTGLYRTFDIKTTRMSLHDSTPKYQFDSQQVPYGIVVDHVAQGAIESFEVLYFECYIDLMNPRVDLYPFMKSEVDVQEWLTNKLMQFQRLKQMAEGNYFPRTDNGCLSYNRGCRYLDACGSRDRASLKTWFTAGGGELAKPEDFEPWIIADIDVEGLGI